MEMLKDVRVEDNATIDFLPPVLQNTGSGLSSMMIETLLHFKFNCIVKLRDLDRNKTDFDMTNHRHKFGIMAL